MSYVYNEQAPVPVSIPQGNVQQLSVTEGRTKSGGCGCTGRCCIKSFAIGVVVVIVVLAIAVGLILLFGNVNELVIKESDFVRNGSDYVVLAFTTEMGDVERAAFENAAAKWSSIVGDTIDSWDNSAIFNKGEDMGCGNGAVAGEVLNFKFLLILAGISPIDGEFGILGQAGPCSALVQKDDRLLPFIGVMEFDSADIELMKEDGTLVFVILHEMGHVLGIGTLWSNLGLIQDEVQEANINQQPKFIGTAGVQQFDPLNAGLDTFVPVENGFTDGVFNGAGEGSLNGHWDEDGMLGELMVFQIASGATPPLSSVTIGALQDAGYTVDFSQAESFTPARAAVEEKKLRGSGARIYDLSKDIIDVELKIRN